MVPCSLPPTIAKTHYTQYCKWKRHISHSHFNCQIPPSSPVELVLPRPSRCELSCVCCHGYCLLLLSYLGRISYKNSSCSTSLQRLQDFQHLLFNCPASEPSRKSIFGSIAYTFYFQSLVQILMWPNCWYSAKFVLSPILHLSRENP